MTQLEYENIFDAIVQDKNEAADLRFRSDLMMTLEAIFKDRGWTQKEISQILEIPQPRVSELMTGKIQLFSSDKLIGLLAKLGIRLQPAYDENHKVVCKVTEAA